MKAGRVNGRVYTGKFPSKSTESGKVEGTSPHEIYLGLLTGAKEARLLASHGERKAGSYLETLAGINWQ